MGREETVRRAEKGELPPAEWAERLPEFNPQTDTVEVVRDRSSRVDLTARYANEGREAVLKWLADQGVSEAEAAHIADQAEQIRWDGLDKPDPTRYPPTGFLPERSLFDATRWP